MTPQPRWKQFIATASRSRSFLWKFSSLVIAAGFVLGGVAHRTLGLAPAGFAERALASAGLPIEQDDDALDQRMAEPNEQSGPHVSIVPAVAAELKAETELGEVVAGVPEFASFVSRSEIEDLRAAFGQSFGTPGADLVASYIAAWNGWPSRSYEHLEVLAGERPAVRYANFALGRIEWRRKNYAAAAHFFQEEGKQTGARGARYRAVLAWLKAGDYARLAALRLDPSYHDVFSPYVRLKLAAAQHDWRTLFREAPRLQWSGYAPDAVAISLIAAIGWMLFLAHLGQWEKPVSTITVLSIAGFALGILSTVATSYTIIWQEDMLRMAAGDDPLHILLYYIGGVGLREEVCKLALFLPLLPVLLKRDDELDVLIVASFVGLGFAIEENASYFANSDATNAAGRFLTANFFHVVLTGCNGLAVFRALRWGVRGLNEFMWVFPASILAHGAYDAFQSMPALPEGSYLAMAIFIAACLWYFRSAEELRSSRRMTLSLSGAFVTAVSLLAAATVVHHIALFGFRAGIVFLLTELTAGGAMLIIFFRIFHEPLNP